MFLFFSRLPECLYFVDDNQWNLSSNYSNEMPQTDDSYLYLVLFEFTGSVNSSVQMSSKQDWAIQAKILHIRWLLDHSSKVFIPVSLPCTTNTHKHTHQDRQRERVSTFTRFSAVCHSGIDLVYRKALCVYCYIQLSSKCCPWICGQRQFSNFCQLNAQLI